MAGGGKRGRDRSAATGPGNGRSGPRLSAALSTIGYVSSWATLDGEMSFAVVCEDGDGFSDDD